MYYNTIHNNYTITDNESQYNNAFVVTQANASNLQTLIDTHDIVKLEAGDYSAAGNIVLSSNQKLLGHPVLNLIGVNVTIEAGSTGVVIENINADAIIFEAGAEISNCTIKTITNTDINLTNARIANNRLIDLRKCPINWDCSTSGYFRNNVFIKLMTQNEWPQGIFKGNTLEPSYGNVEMWRNYLIANGDAGQYDNLYDHTLIGIDMESWNFTNAGSLGGVHMRDIGTIKMASINAYNNGSFDTLPAFDIEAEKAILYSARIENNVSNLSPIRTTTNVGTFYSRDQVLSNDNGFSINGMNHLDNEVLVNGVDETTEITGTDATNIQSLIKTLEGDKIQFDPRYYMKQAAGEDWQTARVGKTDESAAIQALIDNDDIAELEARVYYISQSLILSDGKGIVGKGKGKTIIIGITDDFPLLQHIQDVSGGPVTSVDYTLSGLTLQGGSKGLYITKSVDDERFQVTACNFKDLIFRNQTYGIHVEQFFGFDNIFFDDVTFDQCTIGLFQDPDPTWDVGQGETNTMMYIDKVVFYNCKATNCGTGFSMLAERVNNTNAWINCYFYNNDSNVKMVQNLNCLYINTTFDSTQGTYVVEGGNVDIVAFYGCTISNSSVTSVLQLRRVYMEDCTITDNIPLISTGTDRQLLLSNCNITGTLGDVDDGLLINSLVNGDTNLSKELVKITSGTPTVLIDNTSVPYPQILITKKEVGQTFDSTFDNTFK